MAKLTALFLPFLFAASATADTIYTLEKCKMANDCWTVDANWVTDFDKYGPISARDGCGGRVGSPPRSQYLCLDYDNRRGHFRVQGQDKRCISKSETERSDNHPECKCDAGDYGCMMNVKCR